MENQLNKGNECIGQVVYDSENNKGVIIDFFVENGKKSKVVIKYEDGMEQVREKYAVQKGKFKKPYLDDIDECLATKEWLYIPNFNNRYIINKLGKIKSAEGINKGKILIPQQDTNGYLIITLQVDSGKNNRKMCRIHRLVAESFIRPLKDGEEVNHINGNKLDNSIANLEIVSRENNNKKYIDFFDLGLNENDLIKIKNYCINNNITFKEYILQKIKE